MSDHVQALTRGDRLDDYEIIRILGTGGFGITYLAFDTKLDRAVAIKEYFPNEFAVRGDNSTVIAKTTVDRQAFEYGLEAYLEEARVLAKFEHSNIIKIYRYFKALGTGYIVMEYAEGLPWSEAFKTKNQMKEQEILPILRAILEGLALVHEGGFMHRDIKPGNIMIRDSDSSPVLIDFGAARQAMASRSTSITSMLTPKYAPIEQYSEKGKQGPWTDVYALGATIYRALFGHMPDEAPVRVMEDTYQLASIRGADQASSVFLSLIDAALEVYPEDRLQNAKQWLDSLDADQVSVSKQKKTTARKDRTRSNRPSNSVVNGLNLPSKDTKMLQFAGLAAGVVLLGTAGVFTVSQLGNRMKAPSGQVIGDSRKSDTKREIQRGEFRDILNRILRRIEASKGSVLEYKKISVDIQDPRLSGASAYLALKKDRLVQLEDIIHNDKEFIILNLRDIKTTSDAKQKLFLQYLKEKENEAERNNSTGAMRILKGLQSLIVCDGSGCIDNNDVLAYLEEGQ